MKSLLSLSLQLTVLLALALSQSHSISVFFTQFAPFLRSPKLILNFHCCGVSHWPLLATHNDGKFGTRPLLAGQCASRDDGSPWI